ncbi:hypothetical protein GJ633_16070 [Halorubrum sp. CBA1125]|uniref:hypothetical protein n=1 Tax=Halorubrum sp. CBA1125 TaxID=2668072 RepID=UPI0012E955DC|nr:hypothetical protein [Halorubrum sp. CBA1125]MUW15942.1 hypothetical protein [Halorubrum sp. CBA1125]
MTDADTIDDPTADESLADRLRSQVREHRVGMIYDLAFAVVWVTFVSLLYDVAFASAPRWVLYMFMLAGIPAYFGFVVSLSVARDRD